MAKKKSKKVAGAKPTPSSVAVALDKPEAIEEPPKVDQPTRRLTNAKLKSLAKKHKPPQSWYEEDLDGI